MAEISFYARGDSNTANNSSVNVINTNGIATTLFTFSSGTNGDVQLDFNNGDVDPDTTVFIDGIEYNFTVVLEGTLPATGGGSNTIKDVNGTDFRAARVVVIEVNGQRYFIFPDEDPDFTTMDQFPNGALPVVVTSDGNTPILICFCAGTMILTPDGERTVETLKPGDLIMNADGKPVRLLWMGHRQVSSDTLARFPELRPVRIPENHFGPGRPSRPLEVSPQHRVFMEGWLVELTIGAPSALIPAIHLLDDNVRQFGGDAPVDYYHLLFENHEMIVSNGLPTESLQLSDLNLQAVSETTRKDFLRRFPDGVPAALSTRQAAATSLRHFESCVVATAVA